MVSENREWWCTQCRKRVPDEGIKPARTRCPNGGGWAARSAPGYAQLGAGREVPASPPPTARRLGSSRLRLRGGLARGPVEDIDGGPAVGLEPSAVRRDGQLDAGVPQHAAHIIHVGPVLQVERGVRVPEAVWGEAGRRP